VKKINKKIESRDPSIYGKPKKPKKGGGSFGREYGYYNKGEHKLITQKSHKSLATPTPPLME